MKKIVVILMTLCLVLTGCAASQPNANDKLYYGGGQFVVVAGGGGSYTTVYDKDTGVMYLLAYKKGVCPLYNPDGSLRVYEDERE